LTADQSKALLQEAIFGNPGVMVLSRNRIEPLLTIGVTLTSRLPSDDAPAQGARLLRLVGTLVTSDRRATEVVPMARQLLERMPPDAVRGALLSALAWARTPEEANMWSRLLVERGLGSQRGETDALAVVELLKFPTTAGAATRTLLDALKARDASAPGASAGLVANLEWVAKKYPQIEVDTPPMCPPPPTSGLTCPTAVR
jgi:hypothetical protein